MQLKCEHEPDAHSQITVITFFFYILTIYINVTADE